MVSSDMDCFSEAAFLLLAQHRGILVAIQPQLSGVRSACTFSVSLPIAASSNSATTASPLAFFLARARSMASCYSCWQRWYLHLSSAVLQRIQNVLLSKQNEVAYFEGCSLRWRHHRCQLVIERLRYDHSQMPNAVVMQIAKLHSAQTATRCKELS